MQEPSRMEKMVGELLGLRMIVAQLLDREAARAGDGDVIAETREAALAVMATWPIGSDTPEGAERIRFCAQEMLNAFPEPTRSA